MKEIKNISTSSELKSKKGIATTKKVLLPFLVVAVALFVFMGHQVAQAAFKEPVQLPPYGQPDTGAGPGGLKSVLDISADASKFLGDMVLGSSAGGRLVVSTLCFGPASSPDCRSDWLNISPSLQDVTNKGRFTTHGVVLDQDGDETTAIGGMTTLGTVFDVALGPISPGPILAAGTNLLFGNVHNNTFSTGNPLTTPNFLLFEKGFVKKFRVDTDGNMEAAGNLDIKNGGIINKFVTLLNNRMGIGNVSPATALDVNGTVQSSTANNLGKFQIGGKSAIESSVADGSLLNINGPIGGSNAYTNVAINGLVGIGRANPAVPLDVNGTIQSGTASKTGKYQIGVGTGVNAVSVLEGASTGDLLSVNGTSPSGSYGNLQINGLVGIGTPPVAGNRLTIGGNTAINGTLDVSNDTTLKGKLGVTGATTITGLLTANGGVVTNGAGINAGTGPISGGTGTFTGLLSANGGIVTNGAGINAGSGALTAGAITATTSVTTPSICLNGATCISTWSPDRLVLKVGNQGLGDVLAINNQAPTQDMQIRTLSAGSVTTTGQIVSGGIITATGAITSNMQLKAPTVCIGTDCRIGWPSPMQLPSCSSQQVLKYNGTGWGCGKDNLGDTNDSTSITNVITYPSGSGSVGTLQQVTDLGAVTNNKINLQGGLQIEALPMIGGLHQNALQVDDFSWFREQATFEGLANFKGNVCIGGVCRTDWPGGTGTGGSGDLQAVLDAGYVANGKDIALIGSLTDLTHGGNIGVTGEIGGDRLHSGRDTDVGRDLTVGRNIVADGDIVSGGDLSSANETYVGRNLFVGVALEMDLGILKIDMHPATVGSGLPSMYRYMTCSARYENGNLFSPGGIYFDKDCIGSDF